MVAGKNVGNEGERQHNTTAWKSKAPFTWQMHNSELCSLPTMTILHLHDRTMNISIAGARTCKEFATRGMWLITQLLISVLSSKRQNNNIITRTKNPTEKWNWRLWTPVLAGYCFVDLVINKVVSLDNLSSGYRFSENRHITQLLVTLNSLKFDNLLRCLTFSSK